MIQAITAADLKAFEARFDQSPVARVAMNAVVKSGVEAAALSYDAARRMRYAFSLEIDPGKLTNQKSSGRCWMFAALNTMRYAIMQKLNLENFELSQNYPLFYDKLEKANYFLENILETLDQPLNGRVVAWLLSGPLNDGGQWDMFRNLVEKYGVVPKEAMPETFHSSNTGKMNKYLTLKLREDACRLREAYAQGKTLPQLREIKEGMLGEIYGMLCVCLGKPPQTVCLEARDVDGAFIRSGEMTPVAFFNTYVGWDLSEYVSLINAPTQDKPYGRTYTVKFLGNVRDGHAVRYLNVDVATLKRVAIAQMQDGDPVWFGCDVGQWLDRDSGSMDLEGYDLEGLLSVRFGMTKAQRLDYGESLMTHAMVFNGVNLTDGRPNRWRVQNSWGEKSGHEGWYIMSDAWFDQYLYQIVVNKKYLTDEELSQLEQAPIELQPWDPMGSLALMR